jgi:5-methylcytosine-specific restriction protein A
MANFALYMSTKWWALKRNLIGAKLWCARCGDPAQVVTHVHAHKGDPKLFFDPDNLIVLCSNHGQKHQPK